MLATIGIQPAEVSRILNLAKGTLSQQQQNVKHSIPIADVDPAIIEQQNERGLGAGIDDNEIAPVRSLSNDGEQHTPDSLSALRLEAPVASEAELPFDAPVAEDFMDETAQTASQMPTDDIAPSFDAAGKNGVPDGQQAFVPDAGAENKVTRKEYHHRIIEDIKSSLHLCYQ